MSIAIVGMLDEREEALKIIKERIEQRGHKALLIDITIGTGAIIPSLEPDVSCRELAELAAKRGSKPSGKQNTPASAMAEGLKVKVAALHESGELQGIIAITGMTGALISLNAMKALPFGIPKLLISGATAQPVHAGQFANYFALRDITVMNTVVDTVGMNALVKTLALNGANAICGMVEGGRVSLQEGRPSIALTEFGFCDKGAHYIREILEKDYDLISFHATGLGDKAVMDLLPQGIFKAFIDLVPGAFSEHLLGGNRGFVGPNRLDVASNLSIPYIFCPGGFDIISCGPIERKDRNDPLWTSRKLAERKLYLQDPARVQARMNSEETEYVAAAAAEKLNQYRNKARVKVVIPLKGFSSISIEGGPLHDPGSDNVFATTLKDRLDAAIEVIEVDSDINSPRFAEAVSDALSRALTAEIPGGGVPRHE
jgi:uncharacterized protein (UPF0261 family)